MAAKSGTKVTQKNLTPMQCLFIEEYCKDCNPRRAAEAAGAKPQMAYQWMRPDRFPLVAHEIQRRMEERSKVAAVTTDKTLVEIARLAFSDVRNMLDKEGRILPLHKMPTDMTAAISSIKVLSTKKTVWKDEATEAEVEEEEVLTEYKLWDKPGALKTLADILKMIKKSAFDGAVLNFNFDALIQEATAPQITVEEILAAKIAKAKEVPAQILPPKEQSNGNQSTSQ